MISYSKVYYRARNLCFQLTDETEDELSEQFNKMAYVKIIEQKVLDFLRENISHLPMYAHPVIIRDILRNFESSPMFTWKEEKVEQ